MKYSDYKILLVDDEIDILEFIGYNLVKKGYQVEKASTGLDALEKTRTWSPHLVILDIMMPGMDGIQTCENIRGLAGINQPVVAFLTARGEDYSQIAGFEAGGDDYIQKPIKPKVLESRIKALLKRANINPEKVKGPTSEPGIGIDKEKFLAYKDGVELVLPRKEFELFALLFSKPGRVFTRDEIYTIVWGDDVVVGDRTIDVHIRKLREKLGEKHIKTIKGVGYKYVE